MTQRALPKVRRICLALPDTLETLTWGNPHFRVGDKIFCGYGEEDGKATIGFKMEMEDAAAMVERPGFWKAPYVGHKGWVSADAMAVKDWDEMAELILGSYRLIAPRKSLAKLAAEPAKTAGRRRR